jgi:hypothetical protein
MARNPGPGESVFQLITAEWRRRALKVLAAQNGTTMSFEVDAAIDERLTAAGIPLGDRASAQQPT